MIRAGESAGKLVGTDRYEIAVPMSVKDSVRVTFSSEQSAASTGYVRLTEGQDSWRWRVYAERILPDVDSKTGMLKAVLVVNNPFEQTDGQPVLPIGVSVKAEVMDRKKHDLIEIPIAALREGNLVWVLSDAGKVQIRDVRVVEKKGRECIYR